MWSDLLRNIFITVRVRSTTGRYCFHRCLSVIICVICRGVPCPRSGWGVPLPRSGGGGVLCPRSGAVPHPKSGWGGTPFPGLDGGGYLGYPPDQVWMVGGHPIPGLDGGGCPIPGLDGGVPQARSGWWGCPPARISMMTSCG